MTSTRRVLRGLLLDATGQASYSSRAASANGGAAGVSLIDTGLSSHDDDFCKNWWCILPLGPSGAGSYEAREINAFTAASGTIDPLVDFSAQVVATAAYELSRFDPALLHAAINRACELLFPYLAIPKRDETLVTDQLLSNWDFETYASGVFTGWTEVGTPTSSEETSIVWHGSKSAKLVAAGAVGQMTQAPTINIHELKGKTADFWARIYATDASAVRIRLDWDGTTIISSSYHGGNREWELLNVSGAVTDAATQVKAIFEVADGYTGYIDAAWLAIGSIYKYTIPSAILRGPYTLSRETDIYHPAGRFSPIDAWHLEEDSSGRYILLDQAQPAGRILRIEGQGILTTLSADTGTTEVDAPKTNLVVARAAQWLFESLYNSAGMQGREIYAKNIAYWREQVAILLNTPGMTSLKSAVRSDLNWSWQ